MSRRAIRGGGWAAVSPWHWSKTAAPVMANGCSRHSPTAPSPRASAHRCSTTPKEAGAMAELRRSPLAGTSPVMLGDGRLILRERPFLTLIGVRAKLAGEERHEISPAQISIGGVSLPLVPNR